MREVPRKVTLLLLAVSISLCGLGIYRNEVAIIFRKATAVCMECIGLG